MPADHRVVGRLIATAFGRDDEARLVTRLRQIDGPVISLVAESDRGVAGHVLFSPVTIEGAGTVPVGGLAPLSVFPALQRQGIGGALVDAGLEASREIGWRAIFVLGDPAYYGRFGFEPAGNHGLVFGVPEAESAFQVLELEADVLLGLSGRVRYDALFEGL